AAEMLFGKATHVFQIFIHLARRAERDGLCPFLAFEKAPAELEARDDLAGFSKRYAEKLFDLLRVLLVHDRAITVFFEQSPRHGQYLFFLRTHSQYDGHQLSERERARAMLYQFLTRLFLHGKVAELKDILLFLFLNEKIGDRL